MNLVDRVKNILLTPKTEWPTIAAESATPAIHLYRLHHDSGRDPGHSADSASDRRQLRNKRLPDDADRLLITYRWR